MAEPTGRCPACASGYPDRCWAKTRADCLLPCAGPTAEDLERGRRMIAAGWGPRPRRRVVKVRRRA